MLDPVVKTRQYFKEVWTTKQLFKTLDKLSKSAFVEALPEQESKFTQAKYFSTKAWSLTLEF